MALLRTCRALRHGLMGRRPSLFPNLGTDQSYDLRFQHTTFLVERQLKNTLHGHAKLIEGMRDRLAAPFLIAIYRAQIVNPHNDAIERARV